MASPFLSMQDLTENNSKKAFDYAIRLLTLRDYSKYKMAQKLRERKFSNLEIDSVIEKLIEYNYIREDEYKRMRTKQLLVKGHSNTFIIKKLSTEELQIESYEIDQIREDQDLSSESAITRLIEKKLRYKEIPSEFSEKMKLKNKVLSFLVSKGHSFEDSNRELAKYIS